MSRGMWTKCWTLDGSQSFYYNAAKNQSVWQPPPNAIIHENEAIHLKQYDNSTDSTPINDNVTYQAITTTSNYNNHNNIHIPTTATLTATSSSSKVQEDETISLQDRLAAAAQKQQQNASKRFKTEKESTPAASSAYLQQKSELEAREGKDKGDDTSKWLVR